MSFPLPTGHGDAACESRKPMNEPDSPLFRYLDTLHRVVAVLTVRQSFRAALQEILDALAEHLDFERPHIVVQDPESMNLRLSLAYGQANAPHVAYAPGKGITGQVFAGGQSIIVPCMRDHPDFRNRLFDRTEEQMAALAFVCVPVRTGKDTDVIGTLSADTPLAPDGTLRLRCSFLESVAALVGKQVAYLQEEMARQHYQQSLEEPPLPPMPSIIGASKSIRQVLRQAMQVGPSRATALLRGESGTGKELMAEAIHRSSPRRNRPFVTLNCAALPSELLEGELFGWRKGAFTSAVQNRKGLFEQADKGTLFLDEIGDLALSAQAKILRAIQDRQIQCLGSEHLITVDVRLICATNRPLEQLVEQGLFREDLYYRINVFPIVMPPLRERREDIPQLAEHFLDLFSQEYGRDVRHISMPALELLMQHAWPGNVRELKNVMERAVLVCDEAAIRTYHLPQALQSADSAPPSAPLPVGFTEKVNRLEQKLITEALKASRGNIHEAARELRITYRILYYKMKKYGIDYRTFAAADVIE